VTVAIVDELRRALEAGPALRLAVLFGSAARDRLGTGSDLDVGIVPRDPDLPLAAELDLQARLERACRRPVDLVRLDRASALLRWEAARHGIAILARPPHEISRFLAEAALEHADLVPVWTTAAGRFRRALLARPTRRAPTA
jgi:predicted nucleotidyltransferase